MNLNEVEKKKQFSAYFEIWKVWIWFLSRGVSHL